MPRSTSAATAMRTRRMWSSGAYSSRSVNTGDRADILNLRPVPERLEVVADHRRATRDPRRVGVRRQGIERRLGGVARQNERHLRGEIDLNGVREDLERIGLIRSDPNGNLSIRSADYLGESDTPNEAIRQFHESALEEARRAVREIPIDRRELRTTVIAIPIEKLAEANFKEGETNDTQ